MRNFCQKCGKLVEVFSDKAPSDMDFFHSLKKMIMGFINVRKDISLYVLIYLCLY